MPNYLIKLIFFSLLFKLIYADYRTLNGTYNNLNIPLLSSVLSRLNPPISFYPDGNSVLIPTPGNYTSLVQANYASCSASNNLPKGVYPLPRCVSNIVGSVRTAVDDVFNLSNLEKFKSKRKISHMSTYWGFFASFDIIAGDYDGEIYPTGIYIPQDDQLYLSRYSQSPNLTMNTQALLFQRSPSTPGSAGSNIVTPFLDGSQLYSNNIEILSQIRDYGNHGKMLLFYSDDTEDSLFGYPPKDLNGEYIFGYIARKGRNVFTDVFYLIFLREHNRRCDQLWSTYGDDWSDERYFQECRKWVIALLQRICFYEYLGITLGSPLPPYNRYNSSLEPNIDTFFGTVTFRYGHSEISDYYNIVSEKGDVLAKLPLTSLQTPHLLEIYGVPVIILSMALQRQEEIDIYYSDLMRKYTTTSQNISEEIDIMSIDVVRNRDHTIPLYNDAREAMGLSRAMEWSDITNDTEVQQRLMNTYSNDINKVEALFGGLAEDHINGSDFGELFYKSFYDQWMSIRDSDRFWYEAPDAGFTQEEIYEINNTTLSRIIERNTPSTYRLPSNIWIVQPSTSVKSVLDFDLGSGNNNNNVNSSSLLSIDYPPLNHVSLSDIYEVYWKIVNDEIYFKLIIASTNAWFSIGFNDNDSMLTSDMIIFRNTNNNIEVRQYKSDGYYTPELLDEQKLIKVRRVYVQDGVYSLVEITRPLSVKGNVLKPITENNLISMIYAWNPNSNIITYHAGNKGSIKMDFFSDIKIEDMEIKKRRNLLSHGIAMFSVWAIIYPISIWRVRYMKIKGSYMKKHRNLQMLGVFIVAIFGGVSLAISGDSITSHGIIGISIFCMMSVQIGLGLFNMWSLINVESVNMGITKLSKYIHFFFGVIIIVISLVNVYIGIKEYAKQFMANKIWSTVYLVWIGILILIFILSENIFRVRDLKFRYSKIDDDTISRGIKQKQQLRDLIKDYDQLPMLPLDEFNQRVIRGMKLVIVEDMVFDISKWIEYHPGGAKILQRVIGTNITRDFFGSNSDSSQSESNLDEDEFDQEREKKNQNIMKGNNKNGSLSESLANFIDIININKLGRRLSRVSVHNHSRYATEKLATMVVAKLSNENEKSMQQLFVPEKHQQHYTSNYNQSSPQVGSPNRTFHRCIITNIEIVTDHQLNYPIVKKFTLKPIHKSEKFPYRRFIPGDYIEIMCDIDNQKIIKPYSPLSQEFSEDCQEDSSLIEINKVDKIFWILVKIYKDGFMSKYLDRQLKNFEILVRGPFNLSDDAIPKDQKLSISNCILLNPKKSNGCWDNLFMICGGSGITPMLQLIHYHLQEYQNISQEQQYSVKVFNLCLLFANNSVFDIIYQRHLDFLVDKFKGSLNITHIVVNPPNNWSGLKGRIDDRILLDWLSNNIETTDSNTAGAIPTQIVYYPQQQFTGSSFDNYNTPQSAIVIPYSSGQEQQHYSTSDPLVESPTTIINNFPDNSKIVVCGNDGFMLSIQSICNRIGIKERNTLFLI